MSVAADETFSLTMTPLSALLIISPSDDLTIIAGVDLECTPGDKCSSKHR